MVQCYVSTVIVIADPLKSGPPWTNPDCFSYRNSTFGTSKKWTSTLDKGHGEYHPQRIVLCTKYLQSWINIEKFNASETHENDIKLSKVVTQASAFFLVLSILAILRVSAQDC